MIDPSRGQTAKTTATNGVGQAGCSVPERISLLVGPNKILTNMTNVGPTSRMRLRHHI